MNKDMHKVVGETKSEDSLVLDQEISQLYSQRKQSIAAPEINLERLSQQANQNHGRVQGNNANQQGVKKAASKRALPWFILLGGSASFGLLAVMSHLITPESEAPKLFEQAPNPHVYIADTPEEVTEKDVVIPPLPPKPQLATPDGTPSISPERWHEPQHDAQFNQPVATAVNLGEVAVAVPQLNTPNSIKTLLPVKKVMPEYPVRARQEKITGSVSLRYQINAQGQVTDIKSASAKSNKLLEKSARKALAQWRFPKGEQQTEQEVAFEFTLDE